MEKTMDLETMVKMNSAYGFPYNLTDKNGAIQGSAWGEGYRAGASFVINYFAVERKANLDLLTNSLVKELEAKFNENSSDVLDFAYGFVENFAKEISSQQVIEPKKC